MFQLQNVQDNTSQLQYVPSYKTSYLLNILSFNVLQPRRFVVGTFCSWDVLKVGMFCSWNVLYLRCFVVGTVCNRAVLSWDFLSVYRIHKPIVGLSEIVMSS